MNVARDFRSAEVELKRAIELDPMQGRTREWLALLYLRTATGGGAGGSPTLPGNRPAFAHRARAGRTRVIAIGRYDEALAHLAHIQNVQPPPLRTAQIAAQAYAMKEMWEEAIAAIRPQAERDLAAASSTSQSAALYGYLLARSGQREEADRVLQTLLSRSQRTGTGAFDVVAVYAGLGDFDQAFAWLDRAIDDAQFAFISASCHRASRISAGIRSSSAAEPLDSNRKQGHWSGRPTRRQGRPFRRGRVEAKIGSALPAAPESEPRARGVPGPPPDNDPSRRSAG